MFEQIVKIQPSLFRTRAGLCLRVGIALMLLVAAFMKAHQLATTPSLGEGLLHERWFNELVVLGEMAFAVWLLSGVLPKLAWLAAVLCFSAFTVVSGYKFATGEGSCGCFGAATIPPLWTAIFDMSVVGLLLVLRPVGLGFHWKEVYQELFDSKKKVALVCFVWLLMAIPSVYAMTSAKFVTFDSNLELTGTETGITLLPLREGARDRDIQVRARRPHSIKNA